MKPCRIVFFFPIFLFTALAFASPTSAVAQSNNNQPAQSTAVQVEAKKQAQRVSEQQLATLMSAVGIQADSASRFVPGETYQSLRLQLITDNTSADSRNLLAQTFTSTVNSSERRAGQLPRYRSFELSSQHLVVVTVDSGNRLRWWSLIPDPRILRAEEPDAQNQLSGRVIYQPNVEAVIEIPDDAAAAELRLYHPQWTNDRFVLTLVNTIALKKN